VESVAKPQSLMSPPPRSGPNGMSLASGLRFLCRQTNCGYFTGLPTSGLPASFHGPWPYFFNING